MPQLPCVGRWGLFARLPTVLGLHLPALFLSTAMSKNYINHIGTYNDHSKSITINGANTNVADLVRSFMADDIEDVTPEEEPAETIESIIFTKKAKQEGKIPSIIEALQKSVQGRKDKTRAFVQELHEWQNDEYVDAHYNARVMYDELVKLMPISFGYEIFKKHYNNTI